MSNEKLLLIAVSVRNRLSFQDMLDNFHISETECTRYLARLDKLKIIDLLPNNRIKLRIDENFRWLANGPIENFFEQQIQGQFLKSRFKGELDQRLFLFGLLSDTSVSILMNKMKTLAREFTDLHKQDNNLPLAKRHNIGLMLALRPWELDTFLPLQRKTETKV